MINNKIFEVIEEVKESKALSVTLNIETDELPHEFGELAHIERLILSSCGLKKLPCSFSNLKNLKYLDLNDNEIEDVPMEIKGLDLEQLALGDNPFNKIPDWIGEFESLRELYLDGLNVCLLPPGMKKLRQLRTLNLSRNMFSSIPNFVCELSNLESLYMESCCIENLPSNIGQLKTLEYLRLRNNRISNLDGIGSLSALLSLGVDDNWLRYLPQEIGQLVNLTHLCLDGNELEDLPDEVGDLVSLVSLKIKSNNLKSLPLSIGNLSSLRVLNLDENKLKDLPETIQKLKSLRSLSLKRNLLIPYIEKLQQNGVMVTS